jgi:hypothetical protein
VGGHTVFPTASFGEERGGTGFIKVPSIGYIGYQTDYFNIEIEVK